MLKAVLSSVLLVTTLVACDPVDEADRLIYVKPVSASRNVLRGLHGSALRQLSHSHVGD